MKAKNAITKLFSSITKCSVVSQNLKTSINAAVNRITHTNAVSFVRKLRAKLAVAVANIRGKSRLPMRRLRGSFKNVVKRLKRRMNRVHKHLKIQAKKAKVSNKIKKEQSKAFWKELWQKQLEKL